MTLDTREPRVAPGVVAVVGATAASWSGFFVHNLADLPARALVGVETLGPTMVYLALIAGLGSPARRVVSWLLLGWGWLHLVGGAVLSVLPVPLWPYQPEQTVRHYAFHALYGAMQVPLLVVAARQVRCRGGTNDQAPPSQSGTAVANR